MKKIGIITQARMGSSRLPGKVLKEICRKPLLQYHIDRLSLSRYSDNLFVATSDLPQDDAIANWCQFNRIKSLRGSHLDVLDRYYQCALEHELDIIVRVTSDCPLIDPYLLDDCIEAFLGHGGDYLGNTTHHVSPPYPSVSSRYPHGSDVEVFTFSSLENACKNAIRSEEREHVTPYIRKNFPITLLDAPQDYSSYNYSVDTLEDFNFINTIIEKLAKQNLFGTYREVIAIIDEINNITPTRKTNVTQPI